MILYPTAKINLGLYITSKRIDGFHNIETLFYPLGLTDILEFISSPKMRADKLSLSGFPVPGENENNILLKACDVFRQKTGIPFLKIHLHKRIPMGAGLGGGSADASFLLKGLNDEFGYPINPKDLEEMALALGSDCPYFLKSKPAIGKGRGELVTDFDIDLSGYSLYLFHPEIHVSTKDAYSNVVLSKPIPTLEKILQQPVNEWEKLLVNGFESSVFLKYPEIKRIKERLYDSGAVYASMSGSGSAVFGIFNNKPTLVEELKTHIVWSGIL